ncbi:DUF2306 domain-containing protein [Rhizosphaericola mali]|uniref:hypothetical protein n=1 Tax=Rhizosphaericola mali TaxID=2545455 RepID=UPI001CD98797|nr:hypothetical protein [Rhizosphaericola mali]
MGNQLELTVKIFIYIHAIAGGVGLIAGLAALIAKKGSVIHKKSGVFFNYGMGISALLSLIIAKMPHHENVFLFLIGIFTIYMLLVGTRALNFKKNDDVKNIRLDKIISGTMLFAAVCMVILGIKLQQQHQAGFVLYLFFGLLSAYMAGRDFRFYKSPLLWRKKWLSNHIGKMVGAYIASVTAFLVAALRFTSISIWIIPTIIGTIYIIYWNRKTTPKKKEIVA